MNGADNCTVVNLHGIGDDVGVDIERPFSEVIIYRNSNQVRGNYALVELFSEYKNSTKKIYDCTLRRLSELGAELIFPPSLRVSDYHKVAQVVNWLYRHNHMTEAEKQKLDLCIGQLEKFAQFAASEPKG